MQTESTTPWLNVIEYPFVSREFETSDGWMHYVDAGRGQPIVLLHGAPTWSYEFRRIIKRLSGSFRCIAPDLLGFGLSDKPAKIDYRPEGHARRFADLMDYLRLREPTLVLHDHGGPIGLPWVLDHADQVRNLVLMNTWMWPLRDNPMAKKLSKMVGNPINRVYYRLLNASPSFILPTLFADRHRIPRATQAQYLEPFRDHRRRDGIYRLIESLTQSASFHQQMWDRRAELRGVRTTLLWGMRDPMFGAESLNRWCEALPHAEVVRFEQHGRFLPEEASERVADEIRWLFMTDDRVRLLNQRNHGELF